MNVSERTISSTTILTFSGRLVFDARKVFQKAVKNAQAKDPRYLILNLEKVTFIDSAGLGLLGLVLEECKADDRQCGIVRPKGRMNKLIELTNFPKMVSTFETEQDAIQAQPSLATA